MADDDYEGAETVRGNDPYPDSNQSGELGAGKDSNMFFPGRMGPSIPHYYGDYVRQLFVIAAAALLILAPFISSVTAGILPFQIGAALTLACLAGLTSPRKPWVLLADGLAAAIGVVIFEFLALVAFREKAIFVFMVLEGLVLVFLFGLYFSIKTYRAMTLGQVRRPRDLL